MKNRLLGARIDTAEESTYRLAQVWSDLPTRKTYFLSTEDGKPVRQFSVCMSFEHYTKEPLRGLLIVKEGPVVFETFYCPLCRAALLRVQQARIAVDTITTLASRMQESR